MASRELLDSLSEALSANTRPEWPSVRKAARERAEAAVVDSFFRKPKKEEPKK